MEKVGWCGASQAAGETRGSGHTISAQAATVGTTDRASPSGSACEREIAGLASGLSARPLT